MSTVIENPAYESQAIFRAVMDAFAAPGQRLFVPAADGPDGLAPATAAILRSLADFETPVWLDEPFATPGIAQWLRFNTSAPIAPSQADAMFAVITGDAPHLALDRFAAGNVEYPDRAATVIVQIDSLDSGDAYELRGPGIKDSHTISPRALPTDFEAALAANHALFPCGVDLILVADHDIVALPRSIQVIRKA
ncbi:MAG: phosphonate C-P lyase system protein PhnH [Afipia sp. 62-7]|nr:phosphonate C-P lyase system protein PhnH [Afipia sp.]OJU21902.1 MAG: phosphonate C-P lyase system protein PhnH [Afipia sp. 62-7]